MKKLLLLLTAFCFFANSFASFEVKPVSKKASEIFIPVGNTGQKISLMDLSNISVKDFENISGKHLNFFDRLIFKASQKKLKHSFNHDGTLNNKRLMKYMTDDSEVTTLDKIGWLVKGLILGPLAVIFAYLLLKDDRRELIKWSWFGFIGFIIIGVLVILASN